MIILAAELDSYMIFCILLLFAHSELLKKWQDTDKFARKQVKFTKNLKKNYLHSYFKNIYNHCDHFLGFFFAARYLFINHIALV